MKWTCPVCGYIFEGEAPPEQCPSCKAPGASFKPATDTTAKWAAEHVIGVAKDVDNHTPSVGATIHYSLTVTNHGPTYDVTSLLVNDKLPDGVAPTAKAATKASPAE